MADDAVLEILKSIQAKVDKIEATLHTIDSRISGHNIAVSLLTDQMNTLQQDVRMVRAAINEAIRITKGEVEAIHTDINRLERSYFDLAAKVEVIAARGD
jgi:uncharacterized protein YoxC